MFYKKMVDWLVISFFILFNLTVNIVWAESDLKGSKDHPKIPRIAGTTIIGYAKSSFDEGVFMSGATGKKMETVNIEGKRTRIMYVGPSELSSLGALRNYQKAFANLGNVEEIYHCKGNDCFINLGQVFIWGKSKRIPTNFGNMSQYIYHQTYYIKNQIYWYAKVKTPKKVFHVSVYSAIRLRKHNEMKRIENKPLIHLEVVEVEDFKPTLEVVTAKDMITKISQKGHVALYGINFDTDSDQLKPESDTPLKEISKALTNDRSLNIYVVGHTDNKGSLDYNNKLSKRRANAVVERLSSKYEINKKRMIAAGVGLVAPIASNKTEEGRALNRRVELVER